MKQPPFPFDQYEALVACECSGIIRDALIAAGVRAISCDLKQTQRPGPHYLGPVEDILHGPWKFLMAHPVCKYLTNAGNKHLYRRVNGVWSIDNGRDEQRWKDMRAGARFFMKFDRAAHIPMRATENPIMHGHATAIIGRKADQFIQPYNFGDAFSKATGLHLHGLPKLIHEFEKEDYAPGEIQQECFRMPPSEMREEMRSQTYPGIARAIAEQWGPLIRAYGRFGRRTRIRREAA